MRSSCLRPIAALLLALGLAACGGGKASFGVSGVIKGPSPADLVLVNGSDTVQPAGAASFTFPNRVDYGTSFNITVPTQPQHTTCTVANGSGSAGHTTEISATVTCAINTFTIGGTITGLTSDGLELANGRVLATVKPVTGAPSFVFTDSIAYGASYTVGVLVQPANDVCTVANGAGTMGDAKIDNIAVTCIPKT